MLDTRPTHPRLDSHRWRTLASRLGIQDADAHFAKLRKAYSQRYRKYHNESHIVFCLRQLDDCPNPAARDPLVEFALWCHDVVYRTMGKHNELLSADWAEWILSSGARHHECTPARIAAVRGMIMATCHGEDRLTTPLSDEQKLVIDVDLAILAVPQDQFGHFERAIRREYWWVPGKTFRRNRKRLFTEFLRQPNIYRTPDMRDRFEAQARKNLEHALRWLRHYEAVETR